MRHSWGILLFVTRIQSYFHHGGYVFSSKSGLYAVHSDDRRTDCSPIADERSGWEASFWPTFIQMYWQKKPVLIRKAFDTDDLLCGMTGDDLLEIAQDEDVEARIVRRTRSGRWKKEYGPFEPEDIESLPPGNWTLLCQEVDRHIPSIADIWEKGFAFLPAWRRDDIMISHSTIGGGIGAHVDNYDVFLIQGSGRRCWSIEHSVLTQLDEIQREVKEVDTRLLREFKKDQSWELEPGDMLYLPARVPHHGLALSDDCMTISMGFRAPTYRSMLTAFTDFVCTQHIDENGMYNEYDFSAAEDKKSANVNSVDETMSSSFSLIPRIVKANVRCLLSGQVNSILATGMHREGDKIQPRMPGDGDGSFSSWLGRYLTVSLRMRSFPPRAFFLSAATDKKEEAHEAEEFDFEEYEELGGPLAIRHPKFRVATQRIFPDAESVIVDVLRGHSRLRRLEGVRVAYMPGRLFIDGEEFSLGVGLEHDTINSAEHDSSPQGALLCDNREITGTMLAPFIQLNQPRPNAFARLLTSLIRSGIYYPCDETQ